MSLRQKEEEKTARALQTAQCNALNFVRTVLANERNLLAFIRNSISLLATGIGFIKLFKYPPLISLGWLFISISIFIQIRASLFIVPEENCYLMNCRMI